MKKMSKNQKGITLVEVLATLVIVGILATVAIPAIGGIIDNSKKDALLATADQLRESARLVEADNQLEALKKSGTSGANTTLEAKTLSDKGYIDPLKDPDEKPYSVAEVIIDITKTPHEYKVKLESDQWMTVTYDSSNKTQGTTVSDVEISSMTRDHIKKK